MERVRVTPASRLSWSRTALAIGNFDGVHRGHQVLVAAAVADARARGGTAAVLTFDPHPARVLKPEVAPAALMTLDQKADVLATLGVERMAVLGFTREVAELPPEEFARGILRDALGAHFVVVGASFRFGRKRAGNATTLRELGRRFGWDLHEVEPVLEAGGPISSTRIRDGLRAGRVEEAARLLGRPYFVEGEVVRGEGRGRTLGIPTANIQPVNELLPADGVYAGHLSILGTPTRLAAVLNLGRRPTFGTNGLALEVHALRDPGDLYGRSVRVDFVGRIRDERRFDGRDALVAQIHRDIEAARAVLGRTFGL